MNKLYAVETNAYTTVALDYNGKTTAYDPYRDFEPDIYTLLLADPSEFIANIYDIYEGDVESIWNELTSGGTDDSAIYDINTFKGDNILSEIYCW